jgi:hypothetical protein
MDYNNLSKQPSNHYLGVVVNFKDQKEQVTGSGHGWRYKVAIMDSYSSTVDIKDSEIEYAIALLPCTAGSGGANRSQSVRISQGDVVVLIKISGIPHIIGVYGRTRRIKYGTGRFDAKPGFFGKMQPKNLQGIEEKGESSGTCVSRPLNTGSGNDKSKKREIPKQ